MKYVVYLYDGKVCIAELQRYDGINDVKGVGLQEFNDYSYKDDSDYTLKSAVIFALKVSLNGKIPMDENANELVNRIQV